MERYNFRRIEDNDRDKIAEIIKCHWGNEKVVVHSNTYYPHLLNGFISLQEEIVTGLITFIISDDNCEIISLNSFIENDGIGTKLIQMVIEEAALNKCRSIHLTTTNDNFRAISFYTNRKFNLEAVFENAVVESRKLKPEIPFVSENGILIKDELLFRYII